MADDNDTQVLKGIDFNFYFDSYNLYNNANLFILILITARGMKLNCV